MTYLEELGSDVFVNRIMLGKFKGNVQPGSLLDSFNRAEDQTHIFRQ